MAHVIEMPKLSDTMEEGGIANWLKKEGDAIKEGEPLVEIETDKATQEYESPEEGVVLKLLVQPGTAVPLRTPIAIVGTKGETYDLAALTAGSKPKAAAPKAEAKEADVVPLKKAAASSAPAVAPAPTSAPTAAPASSHDGEGRVRSSPLARKMAESRGVDLAQVKGSGPNGRIVMRDLDAAPAAPAAGSPAQAPRVAGGTKQIPVTMMRKTIAKRLLAAKNDAPHFYLTVSANLTWINHWRHGLNEEAAKDKSGATAKVSVNDLIILAVAKALRRHPMVNASWQGETIVQYQDVHVAMAVALPEGLVTPVIRNTDTLGVREIAASARQLAQAAKDGKLTNDAYAGGTFTISNLGMLGVEEFTAIINPPQAAILAVGAAVQTPWVDEKGDVVVQSRVKLTMSCDHRVVDGAIGAHFLKTLVSFLEEPLGMMA